MESNFEMHMRTYAESKGFVPDMSGQLWVNVFEKFNQYSDSFKSVMPYKFFVENCICEKHESNMHPIFSSLLTPFGIK